MFWMEVDIRFFLFLSYHRGCNYLVCDVIDYGIHQLNLRVCVCVCLIFHFIKFGQVGGPV